MKKLKPATEDLDQARMDSTTDKTVVTPSRRWTTRRTTKRRVLRKRKRGTPSRSPRQPIICQMVVALPSRYTVLCAVCPNSLQTADSSVSHCVCSHYDSSPRPPPNLVPAVLISISNSQWDPWCVLRIPLYRHRERHGHSPRKSPPTYGPSAEPPASSRRGRGSPPLSGRRDGNGNVIKSYRQLTHPKTMRA